MMPKARTKIVANTYQTIKFYSIYISKKKKKCSTAQGSVPMHPPPHTSVPNSSLVQTIDLLIMEEEVPKNLQIGRFFKFTTFDSSFFVCIFLYLIF